MEKGVLVRTADDFALKPGRGLPAGDGPEEGNNTSRCRAFRSRCYLYRRMTRSLWGTAFTLSPVTSTFPDESTASP